MPNWFPFFSMLLWWCVKVSGLWLLLETFQAFQALLYGAFGFWPSVNVVLMGGAGIVLLTTEVLYDLAVAEMQRRQAVAK
jgi:hypothetical protein